MLLLVEHIQVACKHSKMQNRCQLFMTYSATSCLPNPLSLLPINPPW